MAYGFNDNYTKSYLSAPDRVKNMTKILNKAYETENLIDTLTLSEGIYLLQFSKLKISYENTVNIDNKYMVMKVKDSDGNVISQTGYNAMKYTLNGLSEYVIPNYQLMINVDAEHNNQQIKIYLTDEDTMANPDNFSLIEGYLWGL